MSANLTRRERMRLDARRWTLRPNEDMAAPIRWADGTETATRGIYERDDGTFASVVEIRRDGVTMWYATVRDDRDAEIRREGPYQSKSGAALGLDRDWVLT